MQAFEQRHEVPDSEDVRLHEEAQVLRCADAGVEGVIGEPLAERGDAGFDMFNGGGAGEFDGCAHSSIIGEDVGNVRRAGSPYESAPREILMVSSSVFVLGSFERGTVHEAALFGFAAFRRRGQRRRVDATASGD